MRYKSDFSDRGQEPEVLEYMPTCGSVSTGLLPANVNRYASMQYNPGMRPDQPGVMMPAPSTPTGFPTGGSPTPLVPAATGQPSTAPISVTPAASQVPVTVENVLFTPGFLRTQIGRRMRVEFLIGTNGFTDRTGTLLAVGASYIILRPIDSNELMLCDIYSIKFVTILNPGE